MKKILSLILFATFSLLAAPASGGVTNVTGTNFGNIVYNYTPPSISAPNIAFFSTQFASSTFLDIAVTVDAPGIYELYQAPSSWSSFNGTTDNWYGARFDNITPSNGHFYPFGAFYPWKDYADKLALASFSADQIYFGLSTNGPVAAGASFAPIGFYEATNAGTFVVRQIPLVTPIPEPSAVWGAIGGLVFLGMAAKKRRLL